MSAQSAQESVAAIFSVLGLLVSAIGCQPARAVAGFWFEPVTYSSSRFGAPLGPGELAQIEAIARAELRQAFAGLRVDVEARPDARYRVRVVQQLWDSRFRGQSGVAGASRALSMFGGDGAVNFSMLAASAESFAPPDADRATIVAAIGRGIGRAAVHEFAHQLLATAEFEATQDTHTYEYGSADRREQYFGEVHWGAAWPALVRRFGA